MRKNITRQTDSATWSASGTISTDLERQGLITQIDATVEITPSATLQAAHQTDSIRRVVQNLRILGGSHTYFNLPSDAGGQGGTLLSYLNQNDGHGLGHGPGYITAPSAAYVSMNYVLKCGVRPRDQFGRPNRFDLSAFIPASQEAQLTAEWRTTPNSVMDDSVTISSAVMRFTLSRILGTESELLAEMAAQGVNYPAGARGMRPAWSALVHAMAAATTDFEAETEDIPSGGFLRRIAILQQDATATRPLKAADEVTEIRLFSKKTSEVLLLVNVETLVARLGMGTMLAADLGGSQAVAEGGTASYTIVEGADFGGHAPEGVFILDLCDQGIGPVHRDYGYDMRGLARGDFQLGFINDVYAAGDDALILYERYDPYSGAIA